MVEFAATTELHTYNEDLPASPTTPEKGKKKKIKSNLRRNSSGESGKSEGRKMSKIENQFNKLTSYFNQPEDEEGKSYDDSLTMPTTPPPPPAPPTSKPRKKSVIQMGKQKFETMISQKEKPVTPFTFLNISQMNSLTSPKRNKVNI